MRRAVIILGCALLVSRGLDAHADTPVCGESSAGTRIGCGGATFSTVPAGTGSGPGTTVAGKPAGKRRTSSVRYVAYEKISHAPDGTACVTTGYRQVPSGGSPLASSIPDVDFNNIFGEFPPCPRPPRASGGAEPTTPSEFAVSFWEEIPLPAPDPSIAPGRAITGLAAFLETNGATDASFSLFTPLGLLEIGARGAYEVDWGDGTRSGPFDFEGDPWPDGAITHTYQLVGSYDVEVTQAWVADWKIGAESGVLTGLSTTGRIEDFPVGQVQAVVEQ